MSKRLTMGVIVGLSIPAIVLLSGIGRTAPHQCYELDSTVADLESTAGALVYCARRRDFSDDCSDEAQSAEHAAEAYEAAVSEANNDFDGEAADVCQ